MCLVKPFYTWDELKAEYPLNFRTDNDKKSDRYGEECLISIKALRADQRGLISPYVYNEDVWHPGTRHRSNRLENLQQNELTEAEINSGKVYHGYHSVLRVCESDYQWYRRILKFYDMKECFIAKTYRDEFVCGGHWSSLSSVVQICTTHLTLSNISQSYCDGRISKKRWRDDTVVQYWRGSYKPWL